MPFGAGYKAAASGAFKGAGTSAGMSFLGGPYAAGALAAAGALQGYLQSRAANKFYKDISGKVEGALDPSNFLRYVGATNRAINPAVSQITQDALTAGNTAARGISANVNRAGLGNTGVGLALGAGARVGASRGASTLRAQMRLEALREARQLQQLEVSSYLALLDGGRFGAVSPTSATLSGAGSGFEAYQYAKRAEMMGGR